MFQVLIGNLSVDLLLVGTTRVISVSIAALELVDSLATRVLVGPDIRVEASVLRIVGVEATLADVAAIRLGVLDFASHIADVGGSLSGVVLAATATAGSRVLASVDAQLLLSGGWATSVTRLWQVGAREVALATEGLGILLLAFAVLAEAANRSRRKGSGSGSVGVVYCGLVAGDTHGLSATVARKGTAMTDGLGSERVIGDGARGFFNGLLSTRVGGDLGAAGAVGEGVALEIHRDLYSVKVKREYKFCKYERSSWRRFKRELIIESY